MILNAYGHSQLRATLFDIMKQELKTHFSKKMKRKKSLDDSFDISEDNFEEDMDVEGTDMTDGIYKEYFFEVVHLLTTLVSDHVCSDHENQLRLITIFHEALESKDYLDSADFLVDIALDAIHCLLTDGAVGSFDSLHGICVFITSLPARPAVAMRHIKNFDPAIVSKILKVIISLVPLLTPEYQSEYATDCKNIREYVRALVRLNSLANWQLLSIQLQAQVIELMANIACQDTEESWGSWPINQHFQTSYSK